MIQKKSENLTFSLLLGIWRDLGIYEQVKLTLLYTKREHFLTYSFIFLKSPNFNKRKNEAKMLYQVTKNATRSMSMQR